MATFKFRLQTSLNLKEQFEKNAKNDLGTAVMRLEEEKSALLIKKAAAEDGLKKLRGACCGKIVQYRIAELKGFLELLESERIRQEACVKQCEENVDKCRERLIVCMRERKVLENLREKDFLEFKTEEERKEQQRVDELVSYKQAVGTKL